jgi:transposase-like protein
MLYTEEFKKQVVKKVLSPGVIIRHVAERLKISEHAIRSWKKLYTEEVKSEIVQINIEALLEEEKVDIDKLLLEAEVPEDRKEIEVLEKIKKGQPPSQYTNLEKYAIITHLKKTGGEAQAGIFLRSYGLQSGHIKMWEDEILTMGKKQLDQNEIIKKQEGEIKLLRKQLKESERDKRELEILVELKKKYKNLFKEEGEE